MFNEFSKYNTFVDGETTANRPFGVADPTPTRFPLSVNNADDPKLCPFDDHCAIEEFVPVTAVTALVPFPFKIPVNVVAPVPPWATVTVAVLTTPLPFTLNTPLFKPLNVTVPLVLSPVAAAIAPELFTWN